MYSLFLSEDFNLYTIYKVNWHTSPFNIQLANVVLFGKKSFHC